MFHTTGLSRGEGPKNHPKTKNGFTGLSDMIMAHPDHAAAASTQQPLPSWPRSHSNPQTPLETTKSRPSLRCREKYFWGWGSLSLSLCLGMSPTNGAEGPEWGLGGDRLGLGLGLVAGASVDGPNKKVRH